MNVEPQTMESHAERIQDYVQATRFEPARLRGETRVRIRAGDIHKELGLRNRVPAVCNALRSKRWLDGKGLVLEGEEGPRSGLSTTVVFTYRLLGVKTGEAVPPPEPAFLKLRGIAKAVFESLGGGEAFLRSEREQFNGPGSSR